MDIEFDKEGEPHWLSKPVPRDACPKCDQPLAAHSIRFGPDDKGNVHGLMYVDCPKPGPGEAASGNRQTGAD